MSSIKGMQFPASFSQVFTPMNPKEYKLHSAVSDSQDPSLDPPLLALRKGGRAWRKWNRNAPKNDYNRQYVFSMAQMPYRKDKWIFGGVFEIIRPPDLLKNWERPLGNPTNIIYKHRHLYGVVLTKQWEDYIGKAEIFFDRPHHAQVRFNLDTHIQGMSVLDIHNKKY